MKHKILTVEDGSIASELGVSPCDFLLSIDGVAIADVLDYRFRIQSKGLLVEIEKSDGEIWELDIEKDEYEDLGLVFESPLMSEAKLCKNKCIFCFIDQEPPGLRKELYVKDDDWRLSFLHGNFVTLTNLSDEEACRIADLHLSPLNISVHTSDLDLRRSMMGSENADNLFHHLRTFGDAGISMNFQIVLCKGINDGTVLDATIDKLQNLSGAASLAVVPVGLTKHRNGLASLEPFSSEDSACIIKQVEAKQNQLIRKRNSSFVFLSDEWYIIAKVPLPAYVTYEDFPQLSNGVGMIRLFEHDFLRELAKLPMSLASKSFSIITGTLAAPFMKSLANEFCKKFRNVKITVVEIINRFYGTTVTVSGLLTGEDIINQLVSKNFDSLLIPENAFRASSEEMIDGITRSGLSQALGRRVLIGSCCGGDFARQLHEEIVC